MKKSMIVILLAALLIIPLASAGFFDLFTGKATSGETNLSISVANTAPVITLVNTTASLNPTEESYTDYSFLLYLYDHDGDRDVNTSSSVVNVNFTKSGETQRDASCSFSNNLGDGKTAVYSCIVRFWYWDGRGNWNVGASGNDSSGAIAYNTSATLTVSAYASFKMSPNLINWNTLTPGTLNQTSIDNSTLNNTGNLVYSVGGNTLSLNATNLSGSVNPLQIGASLFTVGNLSDTTSLCGLSPLNESQYVNLTNYYLNKGNLSSGDAQETLHYCLTQVPSELEKQDYSTLQAWILKITDNGF